MGQALAKWTVCMDDLNLTAAAEMGTAVIPVYIGRN